MNKEFIAGLQEGDQVDATFAVRSRDLRAARTGDPYLALELSDRSGSIPAVMFRPGPDQWGVPIGGVVEVRGRVTSFRGVKRISVERMVPADAYEPADLIPTAARSIGELQAAFDLLVRGVRHRGLRAVLSAVFDEDGIRAGFAAAPGAHHRHHAYAGGLLEHTVAVASLCRVLVDRYDGLDADLLVTAALLHDVGKLDELRCAATIELTDAGRLLGHVVLGERRVSRAIERVGTAVDADIALRLLHLLVSHHGEPEWGAPARPAMLESVVLHHADHLDAQAAGFSQAVASAGIMEQRWSDSANAFGRPLHVTAAPRAREYRAPLSA